MSDAPNQTAPTARGAQILALVGGLPRWAQVILAVLLGAIGNRACRSDPKPADPVPVNITVSLPETAQATGEFGAEFGAGKIRWGHHVFANRVRHLMAERLQRDGLALMGGDPTPLSKERALELVGLALTDETVMRAGHAVGATEKLGDGTLMGRIIDAIRWLLEHPEVIEKFLKMLMPFILLFL